jgi:hypothetical protein
MIALHELWGWSRMYLTIDKISTAIAACKVQLPARSSLQSVVDDVTVTLTRTLKHSSIGRRKSKVELRCRVGVSVLTVRWQCHQSWVHLALSLTAFEPGTLPDCIHRRCDSRCCHCRNALMLLSPVTHPYNQRLALRCNVVTASWMSTY